jgi:3-isopropylmalate dehydrogenase
MAGSGNIHPGRVSMFEPVHGSAPKYAGTGRANPFGAILAVALMLDYLERRQEADDVEKAVQSCVRECRCTRDIGGVLTTAQAGDAVIAKLSL